MTRSPLKAARLLAGLTQAQVAKALRISQPSYQKWESGVTKLPDGKVDALAKLLDATRAQLLGQREKFDLLGIDKNVSDHRKYYGEVAIHFIGGAKPVLLPISESGRNDLYASLDSDSKFVEIQSLDNRSMFVRREAIADIFLSSEAYDDYGPEDYDDHLGVFPDDDFWKIVEYLDCIEAIEDEFEQSRLDEVTDQVSLSDDDLDGLIAHGNVSEEDRQKVRKEYDEKAEKLMERARKITWQLSCGRFRSAHVVENAPIYDIASMFSHDAVNDCISLSPEGYHRSIIVNTMGVDYISFPSHKVREGQTAAAEEDLAEGS